MQRHAARIRAASLAAAVLLVFLPSSAFAATPTPSRTKRPEETAQRYTPVPAQTASAAPTAAPTPLPTPSPTPFALATPAVVYPESSPSDGDNLAVLYNAAIACGVGGAALLGVALLMPRKKKRRKRRAKTARR